MSLHLLKLFSSWFLYRNQDLIQYILKLSFLTLQCQHPDWTCRLEYYPKPCHSSWFHSYKMTLYNLILIFNFIPSCYFISVIKFITCLRYVFCSIFLIYHIKACEIWQAFALVLTNQLTHEIENMCLSIAMMTIDYCYSIHRDLLFYRVDCIRSWID